MAEDAIEAEAQASPDQFKVRLWAVIGPPGSGKSSTIGTLAGFDGRGAGGRRDILLRGGGWLRVHTAAGAGRGDLSGGAGDWQPGTSASEDGPGAIE